MTESLGHRKLKVVVLELLASDEFPSTLDQLRELPARRVINPLVSFFLHKNDLVRWRSVTATGAIVAHLAKVNRESARVIMRRLMWMLNDESGGIGWGAPEAMAEIMAMDAQSADEFSSIFISYMNEEGNYIEYEALQRGLIWGVGRLAEVRPHLFTECHQLAEPYLESDDSTVRGLAAHAAGKMGAVGMKSRIEALTDDDNQLRFYRDGLIKHVSVGMLAREALNDLKASVSNQ